MAGSHDSCFVLTSLIAIVTPFNILPTQANSHVSADVQVQAVLMMSALQASQAAQLTASSRCQSVQPSTHCLTVHTADAGNAT